MTDVKHTAPIPHEFRMRALELQRNLIGNRIDGITDSEFEFNTQVLTEALWKEAQRSKASGETP